MPASSPLARDSSAIQPGYESKRIERVIRRRDDGIKQSATADGCSGFLCTGVNTHTFYCGVKFLIIRKHFFVFFHPKVTLFLFYFPLFILNWCFTFMSFPCVEIPWKTLSPLFSSEKRRLHKFNLTFICYSRACCKKANLSMEIVFTSTTTLKTSPRINVHLWSPLSLLLNSFLALTRRFEIKITSNCLEGERR